jgi:hypothetical protein
MICGIIGSERTNLPAIAKKAPPDKGTGLRSNPESRAKSYSRWIMNKAIDAQTYFFPYAEDLIRSLAHVPLYLAIDGSTVGQGCMALMIGVVYKKRVLPLVWIVEKKKKGHFPELTHLKLIRELEQLIPEHARPILLGDGEFDGINLQSLVNGWKWEYVLRTGKNILVNWEGHEFSFEQASKHVRPGECLGLPDALFTKEQYGPIQAIIWWRKDCKEPLPLVTNMTEMEEACGAYSKRFRIETFFSDQKSRGFHLQKSHLSDPERLNRLMIGACLAYYWMIYMGAYALRSGLHKVVHRTHRCDLSLFTLGLRLLEYFMGEEMPIPLVFTLPAERG